MAMKDNSLAVTHGLARKDGWDTEEELAIKRVLSTVDDELVLQDRLLSQGRHMVATGLFVALPQGAACPAEHPQLGKG